MRTKEFKEWLNEEYPHSPRTATNRLSNCNTIEKYYGDLDELINKDNCKQLIQELTYSTEDEKNNEKQKHLIPINGNIRTGSATLKQALNLYINFNATLKLDEPLNTTYIDETTTKGGVIINEIMKLLNDFKFEKEFSDVKLFQLSLVDFLNSKYTMFKWDEEYKPSISVRDSIDIIGISETSKYKVVIELDAHRADQVAKKFVSRTALLIDEDVIYLALCYPATKNMSKEETLKYFNYCSVISKKLSKRTDTEKIFGGKIFKY